MALHSPAALTHPFFKKESSQVSSTNPSLTTPAHIRTTRINRRRHEKLFTRAAPFPRQLAQSSSEKLPSMHNSQLCYHPSYAKHTAPTHSNLIIFRHVQQHLLKHILFHVIGLFMTFAICPFQKHVHKTHHHLKELESFANNTNFATFPPATFWGSPPPRLDFTLPPCALLVTPQTPPNTHFVRNSDLQPCLRLAFEILLC